MNTQHILNKLISQQDLISSEMETVVDLMMNGQMSDVETSAVLTSLATKSETPEEILGCIKSMRKHMKTHLLPQDEIVIDTCGTGGDGKGSFNISTAAAFVVAGAGVKVAKHGNRKASSQCGSADVFEKLGVNLLMDVHTSKKLLEALGMTFLFAPHYHPSMKYVATVRNELRIRTIFNYVGPFCNPASVTRQIVGVANRQAAERLLPVAKKLHYEKLALFFNDDGIDEVSTETVTYVYVIENEKISSFTIDPKEYGLFHPLSEIEGGDVSQNISIIQNILNNSKKDANRDIVLLNAALALYVADKVSSFSEGIELSQHSIDTGNASKVLQNLVKFSN